MRKSENLWWGYYQILTSTLQFLTLRQPPISVQIVKEKNSTDIFWKTFNKKHERPSRE